MTADPEMYRGDDWRCESHRLSAVVDKNTLLKSLLKEAIDYIGYASCHGDKCRLPHCYDCNEDPEDVDEFLTRVQNVLRGK